MASLMASSLNIPFRIIILNASKYIIRMDKIFLELLTFGSRYSFLERK